MSVLDAGSPVGSTPNRNVRAAAADALEQDAGLDVPHSACAAADVGPTTPLRRRLKRKTSAEEAGAFAAVSPPSRRLRKKTSIVESPPHAIVPARAAATAEASEARPVVAGSGGASSGMSTMLKRRRRRVEQAAVDDVIGAERQGERLHGTAQVGGGLARNSDPAAIVTGVPNGGDAPSGQEHVAAAGASRVAEHGDNEWRSFTPAVVNADLCLGRTWNGGAGGQCASRPLGPRAKDGEQRDLCRRCQNNAHGRVDGPVPKQKLLEFKACAEKRSAKVNAAGGVPAASTSGETAVLRAGAPTRSGSVSLAQEYRDRTERRRRLLELPTAEVRGVLQSFLNAHAAVGEAVQVRRADVSHVHGALLSDGQLQDVLRPLLGASLQGRGEYRGREWWARMVDEFVGRLHLRESALGGPRSVNG